jgi:hypothetical protein
MINKKLRLWKKAMAFVLSFMLLIPSVALAKDTEGLPDVSGTEKNAKNLTVYPKNGKNMGFLLSTITENQLTKYKNETQKSFGRTFDCSNGSKCGSMWWWRKRYKCKQ